jgi:hypothetical protein
VRDGLPIVEPTSSIDPAIEGAFLYFRPGSEYLAYERIADMEPDAQYRWNDLDLRLGRANLLIGRQPDKGE